VLNKSIEEFAVPKGRVFILKIVSNRCIFLENKRCVIHKVKPFQCKTYPILYTYAALRSRVFKGLAQTIEEDYLVFSCENEHVKIIRVSDFIRQTEERLLYLRSVYSSSQVCLKTRR